MPFYSTFSTKIDSFLNDIKPPGEIKEKDLNIVPVLPNQPIIKTEKLNVVYNKGASTEFWALQDINISIYPKEYIIFFGPSGCGKSTLLNSIAGLETNITGNVVIEGENISNLDEDGLAKFHRSSLGMIFQQYNLISSLSVIDNVILPQIFLGVDKGERTRKGNILLDRFGILPQADKIPSELSGGQQQRIGIARSLINDPRIILADEPVGNLDSASTVVVMDLLKKLNTEEGKTLILVTHNPEHLFYANRIFYMKDGKITREVVNNDSRPPEAKVMVEKKESIEDKLKKEFELLARSFPGLSPVQLSMLLIPFKAKMLVNYMLSSYEIDEIKRIEQTVSDRLSQQINKDELRLRLDKDYEKGGAGLDSRVAEKLTNIVEEVINKTRFIKSANESLIKNEKAPEEESSANLNSVWRQIAELRNSIISPEHTALNEQQIKRMEGAIYSRLIGDLDKDSFCEIIDRPFNKGGVGLNKLTAEKISRDLEMVMLLSYGLKQ